MLELSIPEINDLIELLKKEWKTTIYFGKVSFKNKWSKEGRINIILSKLQAELDRIDREVKEALAIKEVE